MSEAPVDVDFGNEYSLLELGLGREDGQINRLALVFAREIDVVAGPYPATMAEHCNPIFEIEARRPPKQELKVTLWNDAVSCKITDRESIRIVRSGDCQFEFDADGRLVKFVGWLQGDHRHLACVALATGPKDGTG